MLYNIPCRIYILSTLSLCISGIVSTATATSSETKISNEETLVVTTNRSASNLWESPATIQVIDQQTLQNSTNASIADNLQDIPGVEITDNSLAGRKQIRIRGEASSRVLILIDGQEVTYQRAGDNYGVGLLIDESALERVEVVKGPYSVLYGSQAIGGIVNFITKRVNLRTPISLKLIQLFRVVISEQIIDNSEPVKCKRRTTLGKSLLFSRVLYREWWPATYCSRVSGYPHRLPVQI